MTTNEQHTIRELALEDALRGLLEIFEPTEPPTIYGLLSPDDEDSEILVTLTEEYSDIIHAAEEILCSEDLTMEDFGEEC